MMIGYVTLVEPHKADSEESTEPFLVFERPCVCAGVADLRAAAKRRKLLRLGVRAKQRTDGARTTERDVSSPMQTSVCKEKRRHNTTHNVLPRKGKRFLMHCTVSNSLQVWGILCRAQRRQIGAP